MFRLLMFMTSCCLFVAVSLGACGKPPVGTLCYFDTDCPPATPVCKDGVCSGGIGGDGGSTTDGVTTEQGTDKPGTPCTTGERRSCYTGPSGTVGVGPCKAGEQICIRGTWDVCENVVPPVAETCNGKDDDCNGVVDDNCPKEGCTPGAKQPCYTGPQATRNKGICGDGVSTCGADRKWGACVGEKKPQTEVCNSLDDNCDGRVDEGCGTECKSGEKGECYTGPAGTKGKGRCKAGTRVCTAKGTWGPCTGEVKPTKELCNGIDDDCNGSIDWYPGTKSPLARHCYPGNVGCSPLKNSAGDTVYACKGICTFGQNRCYNGKWSPCAGQVLPKAKTCDGKDNDCDGAVDTGCQTGCTPGTKKACFNGSIANRNKGICKDGVSTCGADGKWGTCVGEVKPGTETCNGVDDDCDGYTDESDPGYGKPCTTGRPGICGQGLYVCANKKLTCQSIYQPRTEICNGQDDNCNGQIDEGASTRTYYRDADSDGFGDPNVTKKACIRPAGYVEDNTDCYDKNRMVFPGQTYFFSNHRGDGSFDYNCDKKENRRFTKVGDCKNCQSAVIDIGFVNPNSVACGKPGPWVDRCRFDVGKCYPITIAKIQECR